MSSLILQNAQHYVNSRPPGYFNKQIVKGIDFATFQTQRRSVDLDQQEISPPEITRLIEDLDSMARQRGNEEVSAIVAEAFPAILAAVRWAKVKGAAEYGGQKSAGSELVATWLRGAHVGVTAITNNAGTASTGLYAGTAGGVYSWLPTTDWTAGTSRNIFPSQTMPEYTAIVWLGYAETEEVPKVDAYRYTIAGINSPVLPLKFNFQHRASPKEPVIAKLIEPVVFGPLQLGRADLYPFKTGASQPEPLAILISKAENLTV